MISCKIFLQLMVTVFKENLNLQLPLIFYSSIRTVFETIFISEQTQSAFTCSKLTIETLEQGVKYVQS